jgi:hypothetical protein
VHVAKLHRERDTGVAVAASPRTASGVQRRRVRQIIAQNAR